MPVALTIRQANGGEGSSTSGDLSSLSLLPHQQARHPELTSLEARLKTFDDWPPGLEQRPPQLAEAGFYYMSTSKFDTIMLSNFSINSILFIFFSSKKKLVITLNVSAATELCAIGSPRTTRGWNTPVGSPVATF